MATICHGFVITVHPRVCGEQGVRAFRVCPRVGSSPRVRGTDNVALLTVCLPRFIPACAGNSRRNARVNTQATVHPRVCGEQGVDVVRQDLDLGSSPRVRGTVYQSRYGCVAGRFIPACAGNRSLTSYIKVVPPVHPRVCGEQDGAIPRTTGSVGSSPRVRGTDKGVGRQQEGGRFIPACAGNRLECLAL